MAKHNRKAIANRDRRISSFDSVNQTQLNLRGRGMEMHRPGSLKK